MTTKMFGLLFLSFLLTSSSLADLAGQWPALDTPPPITDEFTKLVDLSKVPNAPIRSGDRSVDCGATDDFCFWTCSGCLRPNDIFQCPTKGDWSLTFDDGPMPFTDGLIDHLDSEGIKATFFVVGSRVVENPEILQKAVQSGHQIGIHTWSHPMLTTQSNEQIIAELQWTAKVIYEATGLVPKYMRPPFGDFDDRVRNICSQLGYSVTIWDKDTNDWKYGDKPRDYNILWVTGNFSTWAKDDEGSTTGHISLEHDLYNRTASQGSKVVPILKENGFNIMPVSDCLNDGNPYQNGNGSEIVVNPTKTLITITSTSSSSSAAATNKPFNDDTSEPSTVTQPSSSPSSPSPISKGPSSSEALAKPNAISSPAQSVVTNNNWFILLGSLLTSSLIILCNNKEVL